MIRGEMPSPGNQQEWGSSGNRTGEGWEREHREIDHSEQGTSIFFCGEYVVTSVGTVGGGGGGGG